MPSGFLDVTPGAVSEAQRNAILARKLSPERVQARHNSFPHLRQFTVHQVENQATLYYVLNQLQGTAQPYVAYTPEVLFGRSPHNGVTVPLPDLDSGSHTITYRWTIPGSNDPVLVDVQPTDLREPDIIHQTILPTGANEIQVDFHLTVSTEGQGSVQGEVLLNGQHLTNLNVASSVVNVMPLFRRARSGLYHLTVHHNGELLVDEAYVQRELAWEQPWPSIETSDVETPIPFSNSLVWKVDDQSFPTTEDQPRWRARFPGALFPPSSGSTRPFESGSSVSFTWLPSSLEIVLSRARSELGRFKLIPSDELAPVAETVQARAPQTTYSYSVEGQAVTYDSFTPVARQTVSAAGLVPAKMRQVYIENARFEPSPPDPEQPTVFRADVQSYFFDDPQIKWTLQIESDDQGVVRTFEQADWLDFDESFRSEVPWDRNDDQGQPSTGNHRATLRVWVQEKTLTNPNGTHPQVLAEQTIDYFVPGTKSLELDYLFSEPPSLESGQMGPVTLIPYAIIHGFPTPPEVSWSLTIQVPGLGDQIFQGANNQDFFEATWEAAGADGGALPDGVYTVQVRAEIASEGLVAEKSFPYSIGDGQGLLLQGLTMDPNPLSFEEQEVGLEGGTVSADITPIGFTESAAADWTLEIKLGDGVPVRTLAGQVTLSVDPESEEQQPTHFEAFWDGRDEAGALVEEGAYLATLRVSCSRPGSEERLDASAETTVAVGAPELEVEDEDSQTLLASSTEAAEESAIAGGGAGTAGGGGFGSEQSPLAEVELSLDKPNNSFLLRGAGQSKQVTVRLKKVRSQLEEIEVQAVLGGSQQADVVLRRIGTKNGLSTFQGSLALAVGTPVPGTKNRIFLEEKRDSFTLFDMSGQEKQLQDSREYQAWRLTLQEKQYGWARDSEDTKNSAQEKRFQFDIPCSLDGFRAAGFETLLVTYRKAAPFKRCWLRVKNQATSLYYSGEGYHDHGIRLDFARVFIRPENGSFLPYPHPDHPSYKSVTFSPDDWNDGLKTIILAGCSVLDVGNFNDYADFGTANPAPGRAFYESMTPESLLLGYNSKAPYGGAPHPLYPFPLDEINTDTKVLIDYRRLLAGEGVDRNGNPISGLTRPMAWLLANASNADRACDDACALENDYYYFIKFRTDWDSSDALNENREIWRVYRLYWTSVGSKQFEDIPVSPFGRQRLWRLPNARKGDVNAI